MTRRRRLCGCLLLVLLANCGLVIAARPAPPGVTVPTWNELDAGQQAQLAHLANEWDRLPASRRVLALERLQRQARWQQLAPEQRRALREGARHFQDMPPDLRQRMRQSMRAVQALPRPQQRELRALWQSLTPPQREQWLRSGGPGISPPPAARH